VALADPYSWPPKRTIDTEALYEALDKKRLRYGLSWREAMRQATGHPDTALVRRLRNGEGISADALGRLLLWLGTLSVRPFLLPLTEAQQVRSFRIPD
jgi:hypothetical protein